MNYITLKGKRVRLKTNHVTEIDCALLRRSTTPPQAKYIFGRWADHESISHVCVYEKDITGKKEHGGIVYVECTNYHASWSVVTSNPRKSPVTGEMFHVVLKNYREQEGILKSAGVPRPKPGQQERAKNNPIYRT